MSDYDDPVHGCARCGEAAVGRLCFDCERQEFIDNAPDEDELDVPDDIDDDEDDDYTYADWLEDNCCDEDEEWDYTDAYDW